jgi:hypothetical protein
MGVPQKRKAADAAFVSLSLHRVSEIVTQNGFCVTLGHRELRTIRIRLAPHGIHLNIDAGPELVQLGDLHAAGITAEPFRHCSTLRYIGVLVCTCHKGQAGEDHTSK